SLHPSPPSPPPLPYTSLFRSICTPPIIHFLGWFSAYHTFIGKCLLFKRYASCRSLNVFLYFVFAFSAAAPHGFYKSRFFIDGFFKRLIICRHISMGVSVGSGSLQHFLLHNIQGFLNLLGQFIQRIGN